jgi:hypothetical protein
MTTNYYLEKGEIISFSHGCYSDYNLCGMVIMIESVNLIEFVKEHFIGLDPWDEGNLENIASFLIAKEKALPLAHRELHMGQFNDIPAEFKLKQDPETRKIIEA